MNIVVYITCMYLYIYFIDLIIIGRLTKETKWPWRIDGVLTRQSRLWTGHTGLSKPWQRDFSPALLWFGGQQPLCTAHDYYLSNCCRSIWNCKYYFLMVGSSCCCGLLIRFIYVFFFYCVQFILSRSVHTGLTFVCWQTLEPTYWCGNVSK